MTIQTLNVRTTLTCKVVVFCFWDEVFDVGFCRHLVMVDDGDIVVSVLVPLLLLLRTVMMMVMTSDVLPQSFLLGAPVLKPHLDHTHVEPRLGAQSFAHLPCRLGAVAVGALQGVQLLAVDCRPRSFAASATEDPHAVITDHTRI